MNAIIQLRKAEVFVSTKKAALMVERSIRWITNNKTLFTYRRKNGNRNLEYELSSVLQVWENLKKEDERKYQVAS